MPATMPRGSRRIIEVYPSTYSAADLPSRFRAAPAKKRRVSDIAGGSSFATHQGFPTFWDSSARELLGVLVDDVCECEEELHPVLRRLDCHSLQAFVAASTALSTSSAVPAGTSAMTSPVAGFRTSIVSPLDDSTHSPPMNCFTWVTETLTADLPSRISPR